MSTSKLRRMRVGDLTLRSKHNREPEPVHVAKIKNRFDLKAVGTLTAYEDGDRTVLIDGCHRATAMMELGMADTVVDVKVWHDLATPEIESMFVLYNATRKLPPVKEYLHSVKAGFEPFVSIDKVVRSVGLKVGTNMTDLRAVAAIKSIYLVDEGKLLSVVLHIAVSAWDDPPSQLLLRGLALVVNAQGDQLDPERLADRLRMTTVDKLDALATHNARTLPGETKTEGMARAIIDTHNKGRVANRLDYPWL
jgi:hypothetical protein